MPQLKKTINTFISSVNRPINEDIYDTVIEFPDDTISCNDTEYISINVISFDMLNTMYNIKSNNNTFNLLIFNDNDIFQSTIIFNIPEGNYSVLTLKNWLLSSLQSYINISYNSAQNTFTFVKTIINTNKYYITPINSGKFLGLSNNNTYLLPYNGLTSSYINMVNYNKIIIRTQNVNYSFCNIENLNSNSNKLSYSDILFWKSKQDIEPFRNICYSNEDAGNSFNLILQDKQVSNMRIQLKNELGDFITDASDYLLVLQFNIYDKEDYIKQSISSITQNVRDIWVAILWIMEKLKLLQ